MKSEIKKESVFCNFRSGLFTGSGTNASTVSTSPPAAEPVVPKSSTPEDPRPEVVQLRYKPEVKPSSSPPKIAETKPTIASDKPNIPLKPSQIREEGINSNCNSISRNVGQY